MSSHHEAIARRMVARLAPGPAGPPTLSPTDETTDESAADDSTLLSGDDLILSYAYVLASVAGQAWEIYGSLDPKVVARRRKAIEQGDMPALQRETERLKQLLVRRLEAEAKTPPELPDRGRTLILDAAAEESAVPRWGRPPNPRSRPQARPPRRKPARPERGPGLSPQRPIHP